MTQNGSVEYMFELQQADSFTRWRSLISDSFVPLAAEPNRPGRFAGRVGGSAQGDVGLMTVAASGHTVLRTPELTRTTPARSYKVSLQVAGHGMLLQDGRETLLRPGDLAIYDTQRPYTLSFDDDFETLVLMFPHRLIGLGVDDVRQVTAMRMDDAHRLSRAVVPFLREIAPVLPELDGPVGRRLALNIVDLVGTLLADEFGSRSTHEPHGPAAMLRTVQGWIEEHLNEPDLGPETIARAHFISTRSLHKLFETADTSVSGWIRSHRLDGCARDLADPLCAHMSVAAIGARWGLTDASHFSRIFRGEHGASPAQFRRNALGE